MDEVFVFGVRAHEINELRKTRKDFKTGPRCVFVCVCLLAERTAFVLLGCAVAQQPDRFACDRRKDVIGGKRVLSH